MSYAIEKVKIIQSEPLATLIDGIINERFQDKVVRILEIGCGTGDFALIFKAQLGSRVDYTGIDPSDNIEEAESKSNGSGVKFLRGDILEHQLDTKYDIILFTKSLHHCNPINKAIKNAYDLLDQNGVFYAEEVNVDIVTTSDKYWFFERIDLLRATNCFMPSEERLETAGYEKQILTAMLDSDLPIDERFSSGGKKHHKHGEHAHDDEHKEGQHTHGQHTHDKYTYDHDHSDDSLEEPKTVHRDDPNGNAPLYRITSAVRRQFGNDAVKTIAYPYFFNMLTVIGLKDTEEGQKAIQEFMKQEFRAVEQKTVNPIGLNILAYKN